MNIEAVLRGRRDERVEVAQRQAQVTGSGDSVADRLNVLPAGRRAVARGLISETRSLAVFEADLEGHLKRPCRFGPPLNGWTTRRGPPRSATAENQGQGVTVSVGQGLVAGAHAAHADDATYRGSAPRRPRASG